MPPASQPCEAFLAFFRARGSGAAALSPEFVLRMVETQGCLTASDTSST
jgi:hypothetical protein